MSDNNMSILARIFSKHKRLGSGNKINKTAMVQFFEKTKDIICICNKDGSIEYMNRSGKEKIKELAIGYNIAQFFSKENLGIPKDIIDNTLKLKEYNINSEISVEGNPIRVNIDSYYIELESKIVIVISDIEKQLILEEKLKEEIERSEKYMKDKDSFIANLSHEIRTPINIITGMVYFLKSSKLDKPQMDNVNKLEEASDILLELVNNVLDFSKTKDHKFIVENKLNFNFKEFLTQLTRIFENKISEKELKWYIKENFDTDIMVYADKPRINQVLINLVNNAIKFTDRGFIELEISKTKEDDMGYNVQFCLKDTGIGIKKEDTLKIFQEFEQVEDALTKKYQGTGIGLAISKKIVESMDGKMWVESNYGLGTKFYFSIPLEKYNANITEEVKDDVEVIEVNNNDVVETEENVVQGKYKVLLVEDNIINIEITKRILEEMDIECISMENGVDAIKEIETKGINYYNLILMDIHMPGHNGYEISKILKNDFKIKTKIIALTATNIDSEITRQHESYIDGYIQKPIKPLEFKTQILNNLKTTKHNFTIGFEWIDQKQELMTRISNSSDLFEKLINIVYTKYKDIRKDLEKLNNNEKCEYIHSLKGAMGNLGAQAIFNELQELENMHKAEQDCTEKLTIFLNKFDDILLSIKNSKYLEKKNKTVLVLDDAVGDLETLRLGLSPEFSVITTSTAKEAYVLLEGKIPDVILLDILLPEISGLEFLETIRLNDKYKNIPVIFLTGIKDDETRNKAFSLKIADYLEKPYEIKNIIWHINNAIQRNMAEENLKKEVKKSKKEMTGVYDFLYDSLVNLTAFKSHETGNHLVRTKYYMRCMLNKYESYYKEGLFLDQKVIEDIAVAATLHDIGKIGIPDEILNKPGKLTDEEYTIMKTHVNIGKQTLETSFSDNLSSGVLQYAKDITFYHHEKYDGTGYPEGISKDQIPIVCRMMSLIDVYDALVNDRVYKAAMPYEEAEQYIIDQNEKAFDPKIINIFELVKDEFREINKKYVNVEEVKN